MSATFIQIIGSDKYISSNDVNYLRAIANHGSTHIITPKWGTKITLSKLAKNESVVAGDMNTYHFLLTDKP